METTTLPVYKEKDTSILNTSTTTPPCTHTPTPHLSSAIASPQTHAHLIAATTALTAATQEGACLKCTGETISQTLTALMQEMRAAKKEGRWSHEEKRALKMEVKGLLKGMKRDVKGGWRKEKEEVERKVQRGWYWKR
jgi:hypothetical protein